MSCNTLKIILGNILKRKENNDYTPSHKEFLLNTSSLSVFQVVFCDAELSLVPSVHREVLLLYTDLIR